jgi:hypothetical protein
VLVTTLALAFETLALALATLVFALVFALELFV